MHRIPANEKIEKKNAIGKIGEIRILEFDKLMYFNLISKKICLSPKHSHIQ